MQKLILSLILTLSLSGACFGDFHGTNYKAAVEKSIKEKNTLIIVLSASWCSPCQQQKKVLKDMASKGELPSNIEFAIVDYDTPLGKKLAVTNVIPQILKYVYRDGKWVKTHSVGLLNKSKLKEFING